MDWELGNDDMFVGKDKNGNLYNFRLVPRNGEVSRDAGLEALAYAKLCVKFGSMGMKMSSKNNFQL